MRITRCPKGEVLNEPFSPIWAPALGARFPLATAGLVVGSGLAMGERAKCREGMKLVLSSLLIAGTAHAAETLPKAMLGKWASEVAACNEQSSELGLTVEPRSVLFYEHGYEIRKIARLKDGSLKASGFSVDDQGRSRGSITLKLDGGNA